MRAVVYIGILVVASIIGSCVETPPIGLDNTFDVLSDHYQPRIPHSLDAVIVNDSLISILWSTLPGTVDGFIIQRRSQHQQQFTTIASNLRSSYHTISTTKTIQVMRYFDTTPLKADTTYYYRVAAYQYNNVSEFSEPVKMKIVMTSPSAITVGGDSTGALLQWTLNHSFPVFTKIERKDLSGVFAEIARIPSALTMYKDTLVLPAKEYAYRFSTVTDHNATLPTGDIPVTYTVASVPKVREIVTNSSLSDMIVSDDESIIVVGNDMGWLRVHKFTDGTSLQNFNGGTARPQSVLSLDPSKTILAVSELSEIRIFSLPSEFLITTINAGEDVKGMALSATSNGTFVATVENLPAMPVKLWNVTTGELLSTFSQTVDFATHIGINRQGTTMVVGGNDKLSVWDMSTKSLTTQHTDFGLLQNPLFIAPSQIFAARSGVLKEILTNTTIQTYQHAGIQHCVAILPDRSLLAVAATDSSYLYDLNKNFAPMKLTGLSGQHKKIFFTNDGKQVFAGGTNGKIFFWKINYGWKKKD